MIYLATITEHVCRSDVDTVHLLLVVGGGHKHSNLMRVSRSLMLYFDIPKKFFEVPLSPSIIISGLFSYLVNIYCT